MAETFGIEMVATVDKAVSQVKAGTNVISGFITDLGKKGVDWTQIMVGMLDPAAIIGGITSLFSAAVLSTAEFQTTLQKGLAESSDQFNATSDSMIADALHIAESTGGSAADAVSSLAGLSKSWDGVNMQIAITSAASIYASEGLGSTADIANVLSSVLKEFGITTVPEANRMMNRLREAARNSSLSFKDFAGVIINTGPYLKKNFDFTDIVASLAGFSKQSGLTASQAVSAFEQIASKLNKDVTPAATAMLGSLDGGKVAKALSSGDLMGVISAIEEGFHNGGLAAAQIGENAGISADTVSNLGVISKASIDEFRDAVDKLVPKLKELGPVIKEGPLTQTAELNKEWHKFYALFLEKINPITTNFIGILKDSLRFMESELGLINKDTLPATIELMKQLMGIGPKGEAVVPMSLADIVSHAEIEGVITAQKTATKRVEEENIRAKLTPLGISRGNISKMVAIEETRGDLLTFLRALGVAPTRQDVSSVYQTLNLGPLNVSTNASSKDISNALVQALKAYHYTQ